MKKGFTLAEVLITLGIIGVVAAMTMPALVGNYKKNVTVNRLKKFYTVMSQATNIAIAKNGPMESWDGFTSASNGKEIQQWFDKYMKPNLKYTKRWIDLDEENGKESLYVTFADGSLMKLTNWAASSADIDEETGKDNNHVADNYNGLIHVAFLTDAKAIPPENQKQCINKFSFLFYSPLKKQYGFFPYAYQIKKQEDYNRAYLLNEIKNNPDSQYCAALIMYDGWEIKNDYPFKF